VLGANLDMLIAFWKRLAWAGGWLVPWLAWSSFAAVPNLGLWPVNA